jgi:hypothetical protein
VLTACVPGRGATEPAPQPEPHPGPGEARDFGLRLRAPAKERFEAMRRPQHRLRDRLLYGRVPEPLPSFLGPVEPPRPGKLGICCSGGGIRSAAFSLGALQVLQEEGELERATYLAAVSGGSYIATAISLLRKTDGPDDSDATLFGEGRPKPFASGSPEEQYLRNRCSYLAPSAADKIFLGLRLVLGLLVNLLFVALPLIGLGLVLAGLVYVPAFRHLAGEAAGRCNVEGKAVSCAVEVPAWTWISSLALLGLGLACGLATLLVRWPKEKWPQLFTAWATRLLLGAAAFALLFIALPYLLQWLREEHTGNTGGKGVGFGAGTLALLAGVAAQLGHFLTSSQARQGLGRARTAFGKLGKGARLAIAYFAAALVGPLMLLAVFALTVTEGLSEANVHGAVDWSLVWIGLAVLIGFLLLYMLVDLTTWSLHPFYKRRLSSVFALRRIRAEDALQEDDGLRDRAEIVLPREAGEGEPPPPPDPGIAVERDYDRTLALSEMAMVGGEGEEWPTLLICAAANVSDTSATPPGRRVTSFTFSGHAVGGPLVGAVATEKIEGAFDEGLDPGKRREHDLSLLAATAMSGAALSPSMGKMTRRPLTFLMALANIRLGVWVPNPRWVHEFRRNRLLRRLHIRPRPFYLLCELFGLNRIGSKYLYVTDGGHYENLGLVELLRRGCTEVYCLDASGVGADGVEFEALGEAITLARSELDVEIEFDGEGAKFAAAPAGEENEAAATSPAAMVPDKETHFAKRDVVTATIRYGGGEKGKLVYVRNTMTESAPWDVRAHHEEDPRFPNNPTIDQLYTDQKFEAYRVLGSRAAGRAVEAMGVNHGDAAE